MKNQGSGAGIGLRHRQSEIQRAGTERGETDAGFAGEMSLGGRHESGALLMAGQPRNEYVHHAPKPP